LIDRRSLGRAFLLGLFVGAPLRGAETRVRLLFAGDVMGHDAQIAAAQTASGEYDYRHNYQYIKPILDHADLAVANLEVTLAGEPFKGYPRFSSPDALADALKGAGFDLLLTANNHACDRGEDGLRRTLRVLDARGLPHTGTFASPEDREKTYPLIIDVNGVRLAFLNATYGTNMLKVSTPTSVNYLDEKQMTADVAKAKAANPDFILAALHWGVEYQRGADKAQKRLALRLIRLGVDAVVGSHPHVIQEIVTRRHKKRTRVIYYSHGNFISNQRDRYRDGGMIGHLELVKDEKGTRAVDWGYTPTHVWKRKNGDAVRFYILPVSFFEEAPDLFALSPDESSALRQFAEDTRSHLKGAREFRYRPLLSAEPAK
jgi:poly-gamma-glutamate capsule biosynthesis protein CapA/YwtB (metallophosphatase superfamily)